MTNIISDLSSITSVQQTIFQKIADNVEYCICHAIRESEVSLENLTVIDIEIGKIYISTENNEIKYKFIPSNSLDDMIRKTIIYKEDPLVNKLDDALVLKIKSLYKELL